MVSRLAALVDLEGRPVQSGLPPSASNVADFFERIGYLVGQRHLRAIDIWQSMRPQVGFWWTFLEPYLEVSRQQWEAPNTMEWFEKLEREMRRLDKRHFGQAASSGAPMTIKEAYDDILRKLRLIADTRNGIYPTRRSNEGGQ